MFRPKRWWKEWRISRCLDDGEPLPESLRRDMEVDDRLRRFYQEGLRLESRLAADVVDLQLEDSAKREKEGGNDPLWHRRHPAPSAKKKTHHGLAISLAMYAATVAVCLFMADYYWRTQSASLPGRASEAQVPPPKIKADEMVAYLQVATPPLKETMRQGVHAVQEEIVAEVKNPVMTEWEDLRSDFDFLSRKSKRLLAEFRPGEKAEADRTPTVAP
jgi:hypothetical protein